MPRRTIFVDDYEECDSFESVNENVLSAHITLWQFDVGLTKEEAKKIWEHYHGFSHNDKPSLREVIGYANKL